MIITSYGPIVRMWGMVILLTTIVVMVIMMVFIMGCLGGRKGSTFLPPARAYVSRNGSGLLTKRGYVVLTCSPPCSISNASVQID